jgi:hypothetical protein
MINRDWLPLRNVQIFRDDDEVTLSVQQELTMDHK